MNTAQLIAYTQPVGGHSMPADVAELIAYFARVSNPSNQSNKLTAPKLVEYLKNHKHWSPFEMVSATVEVNTTRDIARQLLRHRSFSFQEFCVAADQRVRTPYKLITVGEMHKRFTSPYWERSDRRVKIYDEASGTFVYREVKEVFDTGVKPVYTVKLERHTPVLKCTADHKVMTLHGFKRVGDLVAGVDFVACNGIPPYQDKAWLMTAKAEAIRNGGGLTYLSQLCGVSTHCIRKWLRYHSIQFTKKEVASYTRPWNEGLPIEVQPRFGVPTTESMRTKMRASARSGKASNLFVNGNYTNDNITWRERIASVSKGYHLELLIEQDGRCAITGDRIALSTSEVDHIIPVSVRPDLALERSNLQVISKEAHQEKSRMEAVARATIPHYKLVESVEYVGEEQTYDMEIDHSSHNYICQGMVTHNSQRYADVGAISDDPVYRESRLQDAKNRQSSLTNYDSQLEAEWQRKLSAVQAVTKDVYRWALEHNIAKEQARVVLPEGLTPSRLYVAGTLRSFIHYVDLRTSPGTQKEHRELAHNIATELATIFQPILCVDHHDEEFEQQPQSL